MGALSDLPVIHIATHDSFQEGQNGPTHQPVEVDSLFRAMPGLRYMRPCDGEELLGCWMLALASQKNPTMLSLARDPVGTVPNTDRFKVERGAYVVREAEGSAHPHELWIESALRCSCRGRSRLTWYASQDCQRTMP